MEKRLKLSNVLCENEFEGVSTFAVLMIFEEYPQRFYPQLFIACSVITGINLDIIGPIKMLYGTLNFIA